MARPGRPLQTGRERYANGNLKPIKPTPNPRVVAMRRHLLGAADGEPCDLADAEDVVALANARHWITDAERSIGASYGSLVARVITLPAAKVSSAGRQEVSVEFLANGGSLSRTGVSTPDDYRLQWAIKQFEAGKITEDLLQRAERQHRRARFDRSGLSAEDLVKLWDALADDALDPKEAPPEQTKRLLDAAVGIKSDNSMDGPTLLAKQRLQEDVQLLQAIYRVLTPFEGRELAQMFVLGEMPNWMNCHIFERPPNRHDKAAYNALIGALAKVANVLCEATEEKPTSPRAKIEQRMPSLYVYEADTGALQRRISVIRRVPKPSGRR